MARLSIATDTQTSKPDHLALHGITPEEFGKAMAIGGAEWNPGKRYVRLPLKAIWPVIYNFDGVELSPSCRAWYQAVEKKYFNKMLEVTVPEQPSGFTNDRKLRQYQRHAIQWAIDYPKGIWAVDTRLGKCCMTVGLSEHLGLKKVLIVTPGGAVKWNWEQEIQKFTDYDPNIYVTEDKWKNRWMLENYESGYFVAHYEGIVGVTDYKKHEARHPGENDWWECLGGPIHDIDWDLIVVDECQLIKNAWSKRGLAVRALDAPRKLPMSGTPMPNGIHELWSMINWINPDFYPDYELYEHTFCKFQMRKIGKTGRKRRVLSGYKDEITQLHHVVKQYMLRIAYSEVVTDIKEKVSEIERFVEMNDAQRKIYNQMKQDKGFYNDAGELVQNPMSIRARVDRLLMSPRLVDPNASIESPKIDQIVFEAQTIKDPIVVMCMSPDFVPLIAEALRKAGIKTIDMTAPDGSKERMDKINEFQNGDAHVFVTTIGIAQVGIPLHRANTCIFATADYVPVKMLQAMRRIENPEKTDHRTIIHLISRGWDERKYGILKAKQALISFMIDGHVVEEADVAGLFTELVHQEFLD